MIDVADLSEIPEAYWSEARRRALDGEWAIAYFLDQSDLQDEASRLPAWARPIGYDVGERPWDCFGGFSLLWSEHCEPGSSRAAILQRRNGSGLLDTQQDVLELLEARRLDQEAGADVETHFVDGIRIYLVGLARADGLRVGSIAPRPTTAK